VFPVHENAKIFSLLILILGVSPIVAPTAGGFITAHFGWHAIFVLLASITFVILLLVIWALPESKPPDPTFSLRPAPILASFRKVIIEPQFYTYALTGATASAGLYAYLAGSPFVFMDLYHVSSQQYGGIFALVAGGLIASSQLNNLMLRKYSSEYIIRAVISFQSVVAIVLVAGTYFHLHTLASTIACIFLYLCCQGFSFPNSSALSMAPFTKEAGSASALMGSIQMALGAVAAGLVGLFSNHTAMPMVCVMAACSLAAFSILMIGRRMLIQNCRKEDIEETTFEMIERS
jgi:DHA1 family bicyclomycin/chloramphenicol resistance-like MFS transporter